jgi:hypothetical protein
MLPRNNGESDAVIKLATAVAINSSVFYTGLLIAFHIPAVHAITSRANNTPQVLSMTTKERQEWLTQHDLADTWVQYYARIGAVLSPLIAGLPLTKVLTFIHG